MILPIDEVNKRSIPYREYFDIMKISKKQKNDRIRFAERLEDELFLIYELYGVLNDYSVADDSLIIKQLTQAYIDTVSSFAIPIDDYIQSVADKFATDFVDTTRKHLTLNVGQDITTTDGFGVITAIEGAMVVLMLFNADNEPIGTVEMSYKDVLMSTSNSWYLSNDRITYNAENEANTVMNYKDYTEAKGTKKYKTWYTEADDRVRPTHVPLEGETIPIDDLFVVGAALMRYPKDVEYCDDDSEICNCRCSIEYS